MNDESHSPILDVRKHPARQPLHESGNLSPIVYLTVCAKDRKPLLAKPDIQQLLIRVWSDPANHWTVGRYVLLPDHLHLFCSPKSPQSLGVKKWTQFWKSEASKQWPRPEEHPVWLTDGWDTQLRTAESHDEKWDYVRNNPVRHGMVENVDDWPFQGEIEPLEWHDR